MNYFIFAAGIVFTPLLRHRPDLAIFIVLLVVTALIPVITRQNRFSIPALITAIILIFLGSLISGRLMNYRLGIDYERTIFGHAGYQNQIKLFSTEALYLPYRIRPLIFNSLVYVSTTTGHILKFLNLSTIISSLLLVNLVHIVLGLAGLFRSNQPVAIRLSLLLFSGLIAAGFSLQPDTFAHLYLLLPVFVFLVWRGCTLLSPKVSLALLLVSLIWIWIP